MTICEYFFNNYKRYEDAPKEKKPFLVSAEPGSLLYVSLVFGQEIGAAWRQQLEETGITKQQLDAAVKNGYIKHTEYSNWYTRQTKLEHLYRLTKKGMRTIYKAFEGRW